MPEILVPVGRHFFQPADLTKALSVLPPDAIGPQGFGAKAAIDTEGARVALLYSIRNGAIVARGAFAYDWGGKGYRLGADLTFKL